MTGAELARTGLLPPDLCKSIIRAEYIFYKNDAELLEDGDANYGAVSEMAIVFRFGHYLQNELTNFSEYRTLHLDNEYNKHEYDEKLIRSGKSVRPDLCLHERRTDANNLLVMEFKKEGCGDDSEKVRYFTLPNPNKDEENRYKYGYKYGLFITITLHGFLYKLYIAGELVGFL